MNRNTEAHFSQLPTLEISRSKFNMGHQHITTFNTGELVPIYVDPDIVPGDTVSMRMADVVRMMTPIAPVMDSAFMDVYFFFVPNRLVDANWKRVMGENDTAPWTQQTEYVVPQLKFRTTEHNTVPEGDDPACTTNVLKGSVLDHMGIPQMNWEAVQPGLEGYKELKISALPTRSYALIWNEFFRDENLQNPVDVPTDDTDRYVHNTYDDLYVSDSDAAIVQWAHLGGLPCLPVCKSADYFTTALPGAQKGQPVKIPLSSTVAPVEMGKSFNYTTNKWEDGTQTGYAVANHVGTETSNLAKIEIPDVSTPASVTGVYSLVTDLTKVTGATVQALRQCFAIQKFYERDARGGTRYIESIWAHFRVRNPDFRMQRPEYLGGFRQIINMNQVVQNSPTEAGLTPLGTTGAFSVTSTTKNDLFSHSFTEHGCLIGLCCVRTEHTYCQGINRAWFKKSRLDWYSPEFANLSEMAILNRELYVQGDATEDEKAFGYQEAWGEMRYKPNICSSEMSLLYGTSLGTTWTYADKYDSKPTLGDKWIQETKNNMQRTLAIQSHDQFMGDFYFEPIYTRPLPLYSVPGLIDHH